jgi:hypothetical protein
MFKGTEKNFEYFERFSGEAHFHLDVYINMLPQCCTLKMHGFLLKLSAPTMTYSVICVIKCWNILSCVHVWYIHFWYFSHSTEGWICLLLAGIWQCTKRSLDSTWLHISKAVFQFLHVVLLFSRGEETCRNDTLPSLRGDYHGQELILLTIFVKSSG